jgi:hypothetical protein
LPTAQNIYLPFFSVYDQDSVSTQRSTIATLHQHNPKAS